MSDAILTRRRWLAPPDLPLVLVLAAAPAAVVLQHRALAPVALGGLLGCVLLHAAHRGGRQGAWPVPRDAASVLAILLFAWAAVTAFWSPSPAGGVFEAARLAGFALLGGGAATAAAALPEAGRRRVGTALLASVALGLALGVADMLTGHAIRGAVRGMRAPPVEIVFGLKPSGSVLALLLPLAVVVPGLPGIARVALAVIGAAGVIALPGDSAKIAAVLGLLVTGAAWWLPGRWLARAIGMGLAAVMLAAPLVFAAVLDSRVIPAERIAVSAAHRLIIWDYALRRIADRPVLGWGMDSSRAIPGGQDRPDAAALTRIGLVPGSERSALFAPDGRFNVMPLHPHNAFLQVWLELGAVGAVLAAGLLSALGFAAGRLPPAVRAGACGAMTSAAVSGLLSYGVWQPWWIGGLLLAIAAAAGIKAREERAVAG
ncbi:O-antigen ligase family protein [Roseomonas sp. CCTCC AB2023176]|uniref:O-antigen ligase family protein n=1 Tax=Roseomonas sp. CCTCC AB2023176 TaxID=3342640 RepID=UPI0035DA75B8